MQTSNCRVQLTRQMDDWGLARAVMLLLPFSIYIILRLSSPMGYYSPTVLYFCHRLEYVLNYKNMLFLKYIRYFFLSSTIFGSQVASPSLTTHDAANLVYCFRKTFSQTRRRKIQFLIEANFYVSSWGSILLYEIAISPQQSIIACKSQKLHSLIIYLDIYYLPVKRS